MEFEERARAVLPPHISAYYAAPAGSEADLDEGDTRLVGDPVPAAGASRHRIADLSTTVLGTPVRTPVLVAPMAYQVGAHPDGERARARAVAAAGSCSACQPTPPFLCCHCRHRRAVVVPAGDQDLTDDLARVMIQIGAGSIAELTSDLLAR